MRAQVIKQSLITLYHIFIFFYFLFFFQHIFYHLFLLLSSNFFIFQKITPYFLINLYKTDFVNKMQGKL